MSGSWDEPQWKFTPGQVAFPHAWRVSRTTGVAHLVQVEVLERLVAGTQGAAGVYGRCGQRMHGGVRSGRAMHLCGKCERLATHPSISVVVWDGDGAPANP